MGPWVLRAEPVTAPRGGLGAQESGGNREVTEEDMAELIEERVEKRVEEYGRIIEDATAQPAVIEDCD